MSCRASTASQTYQSSLIILTVDFTVRHGGRHPATPAEHLCARQLAIDRWGRLRHDKLTALVEENEMPAGSDQRAAPDVLAPFHFTARSVETTQLAFADIPVDAKDRACTRTELPSGCAYFVTPIWDAFSGLICSKAQPVAAR